MVKETGQRTSYRELAGINSFIDYHVRNKLSSDIIDNARDLIPSVDWSFILDHVHTTKKNVAMVTGRAAVGKILVPTIGSIAKKLQWSMDRPEIVYMSGLFFEWVVGKEIENLNDYVQSTNAGEKKFVSNDQKEETIKNKTAEAVKLGKFAKTIREKLDLFFELNWPETLGYGVVLRELLFSGLTPDLSQYKIDKVLKLVAEDKIDEAYELIQKRKKEKVVEVKPNEASPLLPPSRGRRTGGNGTSRYL